MRTRPAQRGPLEGRGRGRVSPWPRRLAAVALVGALVTVIGLWLGGPGELGESMVDSDQRAAAPGPDRAEAGSGRKQRDQLSPRARAVALEPVAPKTPVRHDFDRPPLAGVMFDVDSGEVLWERHLGREAPIASLTKMMTAHLIAKRHASNEQVRIPKEAVGVGGSMVGLLPPGKKVPLGALLKGLLLVSGNDAAVALADDDAGSVGNFVDRMNAETKRLGLTCSGFSTPHGLEDRGNYSCPRDLAAMARLLLGDPRLAKIMGSSSAKVDFPIPGGTLELANNNPFIRAGDKSVTGVKTGFTEAAGRCYVMTAKRGGRHLGVVLLDSPDPLEQVPKLWKLGFEARG